MAPFLLGVFPWSMQPDKEGSRQRARFHRQVYGRRRLSGSLELYMLQSTAADCIHHLRFDFALKGDRTNLLTPTLSPFMFSASFPNCASPK